MANPININQHQQSQDQNSQHQQSQHQNPQDMVWISRDRLEVLKAQARASAQKNIPLNNMINDLRNQIRVVHCISSQYFFGSETIYENDPREALFTSISMLREALAHLESEFDLNEITINGDWGKFVDWPKLTPS